jgi:hypothetical protein
MLSAGISSNKASIRADSIDSVGRAMPATLEDLARLAGTIQVQGRVVVDFTGEGLRAFQHLHHLQCGDGRMKGASPSNSAWRREQLFGEVLKR